MEGRLFYVMEEAGAKKIGIEETGAEEMMIMVTDMDTVMDMAEDIGIEISEFIYQKPPKGGFFLCPLFYNNGNLFNIAAVVFKHFNTGRKIHIRHLVLFVVNDAYAP